MGKKMSPLAASHQYWFHRRGQTLRLASACLNSSYVEPSRDFRLLARGWRNLDGGKYVTVVPNGEIKKKKKESRETDENGWTFQKFKSDDLIDVSRNFCIVIRIKKKTVLKFNCKNKNLFQPLLRFTRIFKHDIESSSNSRFFFANSILRCKKKKNSIHPFETSGAYRTIGGRHASFPRRIINTRPGLNALASAWCLPWEWFTLTLNGLPAHETFAHQDKPAAF